MKKLSLRTLVLLMAVLMIVTSVSVFTLTASAATAPAEGMTFVQDSYYEMTKVSGVKNAMTIEASIWIAHNAGDGRHGTVEVSLPEGCDKEYTHIKSGATHGLQQLKEMLLFK